MKRPFLLLALLLAGCGSSGPATTQTASSEFATLPEKTKFLERYVKFRRTYEALDFQIKHINGGGLAPSEWDLRLVAKVPASELPAWVPPGVAQSSTADRSWLATVPTSLDLSGFTEWYVENHRMIGIDRKQSLVACRNWAN
jgi:hypothetical protein